MRARLRNKYDDKYSVTVQLPQTPLELYDILDRLGADNKYCNVYINIDDERIPDEMCEGGFYDDLFKLNLLAQRLEQLTPSYGIISGQGQKLYTPIYTEQEQTEDETESEEMGACLT